MSLWVVKSQRYRVSASLNPFKYAMPFSNKKILVIVFYTPKTIVSQGSKKGVSENTNALMIFSG